jgi:hypothetical protein
MITDKNALQQDLPKQEVAKLTKEQAIIITGFTGFSAIPLQDFVADLERRSGKQVWTHQFADENFMEEVKELYRDDFVAMCQ